MRETVELGGRGGRPGFWKGLEAAGVSGTQSTSGRGRQEGSTVQTWGCQPEGCFQEGSKISRPHAERSWRL